MIIIDQTTPNAPMPEPGLPIELTGEVWRVRPVTNEYLRQHPYSQRHTVELATAVAKRWGLTLEFLD